MRLTIWLVLDFTVSGRDQSTHTVSYPSFSSFPVARNHGHFLALGMSEQGHLTPPRPRRSWLTKPMPFYCSFPNHSHDKAAPYVCSYTGMPLGSHTHTCTQVKETLAPVNSWKNPYLLCLCYTDRARKLCVALSWRGRMNQLFPPYCTAPKPC